jgi:hypothetical protein
MPVDRDRLVGFFGRRRQRHNHLRGAEYVADFRHRGDIGKLQRPVKSTDHSLGLFASSLYWRLYNHRRVYRHHLHEE